MSGQVNYLTNTTSEEFPFGNSLESTRTIADDYREQELINIAEGWLAARGIQTRDNTYEHNLLQSWKILLDLGEYLEAIRKR